MKNQMRKAMGIVMISTSVISGCSSTIHKRAQLHDIQTLSIDAKQRLTLANNRITCTEPSPDALVAQSAALSANINTPQQLAASLGASSTESAGSIGLRTQTIQVLRDGYFRICEAYLNGAIGEKEYQHVLNNVDGVITAVLAIETLGGTIAAPAIGLTPGASTTSANGEGATAKTTGSSVNIENIIQAQGTLSDRQAEAIEAITLSYFDMINKRNGFLAFQK